ncbi:hypothetical protein [Massilia pseudoviolaceinigra]|uniref:hypothetical protein n=1 Tax=Massilia pseudoviolaceinigra TaxID=3057165 RepID=UPI0027967F8F|nr:hypothetical protein [Massilia sp. CCM 9206]MDQ1923056.1 hypothetical protein [Massilia sp. CCM 9206]
MKIYEWEREIARVFSAEKVTADFYAYAEFDGMNSGTNIVCTIDDVTYEVPIGTPLEIVARVIQFNSCPSFAEIRVVAAVGGVLDEEQRFVPHAKYFFAKLYYNEDFKVYSADVERFQ